jgi:hypothetical protein
VRRLGPDEEAWDSEEERRRCYTHLFQRDWERFAEAHGKEEGWWYEWRDANESQLFNADLLKDRRESRLKASRAPGEEDPAADLAQSDSKGSAGSHESGHTIT